MFTWRESRENLARVPAVQFGDLPQKIVVGSHVAFPVAPMIEAEVSIHCRDKFVVVHGILCVAKSHLPQLLADGSLSEV